ncbi:MAG: dephospho-CoA kinase [bacterium]|nr:dephospho-CoA kinase [bacterium]
MKIIGITGGVGAGKSMLLSYIERHYPCRVVYADVTAKQLQEKGGACYTQLVRLLGSEVLSEDGRIDKTKMAQKIFADDTLLAAVNAIVHPAVKQTILAEIQKERTAGQVGYFFIEAALLIEEHYDEICDELWYIYADEDARVKRLADARGYAEEKTEAIMKNQLAEEAFRRHCRVVIDNSRTPEEAYAQIDRQLGGSARGL